MRFLNAGRFGGGCLIRQMDAKNICVELCYQRHHSWSLNQLNDEFLVLIEPFGVVDLRVCTALSEFSIVRDDELCLCKGGKFSMELWRKCGTYDNSCSGDAARGDGLQLPCVGISLRPTPSLG